MTLDKKTTKKVIWLIVLAGLVLVIAMNITNVISGISFVLGIIFPFFLGGCMAFVLNIPMSFLERTLFKNREDKKDGIIVKLKRPLSMLLAIVIILAIVALVMLYFVPKLTSALTNLADNINMALPEWSAWLNEKFAKWPAVVNWLKKQELTNIDFESTIDQILGIFVTGADTGFNKIIKITTTVINQAVNIGIAIAVACYLCASKEKHFERFNKLLYGIVPRKGADRFLAGCRIANDTFHHFITGQCLESLCLGVLAGTIFAIARMPYAFVIAIICAICCFIPIFGAIIAGVCGGVIVLSSNPDYIIAFIIIYVIIRVFDDNFMYPHVIGKSIDMPAVFVLFAITIGGALFGFGGMLFFIPLTSFIYRLIRTGVEGRLEKKKLDVDSAGNVTDLSPGGGPNAFKDKT